VLGELLQVDVGHVRPSCAQARGALKKRAHGVVDELAERVDDGGVGWAGHCRCERIMSRLKALHELIEIVWQSAEAREDGSLADLARLSVERKRNQCSAVALSTLVPPTAPPGISESER
jgi:hypothetical protein